MEPSCSDLAELILKSYGIKFKPRRIKTTAAEQLITANNTVPTAPESAPRRITPYHFEAKGATSGYATPCAPTPTAQEFDSTRPYATPRRATQYHFEAKCAPLEDRPNIVLSPIDNVVNFTFNLKWSFFQNF